MPNDGGRNIGRRTDRVGHSAFERALSQLADEQANGKVLLVRRHMLE